MLIKRIDGSTRSVECGSGPNAVVLPVCEVDEPDGKFMVSAWEPTPGELEALQEGKSLKLWIAGVNHPLVKITVGDVEIESPA